MKFKTKVLLSISLLAFILTIVPLTFTSCTKETSNILTEIVVQALASWNAQNEKLSQIPQDVIIHDPVENIPASIDLTPKFPPIGNQGSYGTCVAWAIGYNLKTTLDGIDNQWSASQLSQAQNQTSPKDLYWSIPAASKGTNCNGTQFEAAMDALISRGGASLATVPYTNMGDCSQTPPAEWTQDASDNKLVNYRKIADQSNAASMTVKNFKSYLAEGRPIAIGARLGDRFMAWSSDAVLDNDTYLNPGMQHAYHAMVLAGYDDSKSAFRVVNSWGNTWGNNGTIWVDYDFFVSKFCFCGFVAQNKSDVNVNGNVVVNGDIVTGLDVLAWNLVDADNPDSTNARCRQITYNVFNSGTQTVKASSRWSILYLYYNAYDANDYGILIQDYYTDEFSTVPGANDFWANGQGIAGSWWNYIDVPSGKSVAAALYNQADADFQFTYTMPGNLSGSYYLVLVADGFNDLAEANEDNNYFFYSKADGKPFDFVNGVIQNGKSGKSAIVKQIPAKFANTEYQTLVGPRNVNTYSPKEIMGLIQYRKQTGDLQRMARQFKSKSANQSQAKRSTIN